MMEILGFWIPAELLVEIFMGSRSGSGSTAIYRRSRMVCKTLRGIVEEVAKGIRPRFQDAFINTDGYFLVEELRKKFSPEITERILKTLYQIPSYVIGFGGVRIEYSCSRYDVIAKNGHSYWHTMCSACKKIYARNILVESNWKLICFKCCYDTQKFSTEKLVAFEKRAEKFWETNFEFFAAAKWSW